MQNLLNRHPLHGVLNKKFFNQIDFSHCILKCVHRGSHKVSILSFIKAPLKNESLKKKIPMN